MPAFDIMHNDCMGPLISNGQYLDSTFHPLKTDWNSDYAKPLIYVTDPDNVEGELWVPPTQEDSVHSPDNDSDNETSPCTEDQYYCQDDSCAEIDTMWQIEVFIQ